MHKKKHPHWYWPPHHHKHYRYDRYGKYGKYKRYGPRGKLFLRAVGLLFMFVLCSVCSVVGLGMFYVGPRLSVPGVDESLVGYYVEAGGSWEGVGGWVESMHQDPEGRLWESVTIADESGRILVDPRGGRVGEMLTEKELRKGTPIEVEGRRVGTVVVSRPLYLLPSLLVLNPLVLAGLAVGLTALLVGAIVSRHITAPIADIIEAAEALASGDMGARVNVRGNRHDEVSMLARTFNEMADSLQKQAQDLQRVDEMRRNLTADIAHELRTPLTIMQGQLEGIQDGVYDPTPEQVESILEETRLLSRLVDDLHLLALAETGQLVMERGEVEVCGLLADAARSFRSQAQERGIAIEMHCPEGLPAVYVDPHRIQQVLGNLLGNALRYTPPGGTITLAAVPSEGQITVRVSDTGTGIPPEDLPYIFDRFWKEERSRRRTGGGAGLGLAIARQLVEAHGGSIHAESGEGQGTSVSFTLPTVDAPYPPGA